jgi:tRNA (mo5U34)-methyltransferase
METNSRLLSGDGIDDFYWYHCIDFGDGVVTDGDYAMSEYINHFQFPFEMAGKSVLDVGRASGFFAFEFERRGANVTATEIESVLDWDFVAGGREAYLLEISRECTGLEHYNKKFIRGSFFYARDRLRSKVKDITCTVYDLDPDLFGGHKFDLVFAGSITSHLSDIVGGLKRLRSVTADGGLCIVSAPFLDVPEVRSIPTLSLIGTASSARRSWWIVNARGLEELLKSAGFEYVTVVANFVLENRRIPSMRMPHVVAHARP